MKNIYILPTNKLSKIYQIGDSITLSVVSSKHQYNTGRHIYIISDEEIKGEEWYLWENLILKNKKGDVPKSFCKKIILTTDQDLIKDGVQVIDDEFLKWLVKNPNCETVEIKEDECGWFINGGKDVEYRKYNYIEIPKKQPKEFGCPFDEKIDYSFKNKNLEKYSERFDNDKSAIGNPETWGKRIKKEYVDDQDAYGYDVVSIQKTLEEDSNSWHLAKELFKEVYGEYPKTIEGNIQDEMTVTILQKGIVYGAKWQQKQDLITHEKQKDEVVFNSIKKVYEQRLKQQQERSYSEEEVLDLLFDFQIHRNDLENCVEAREWFEQFKKK